MNQMGSPWYGTDMAANMTASELADHVTRNWHVLTGRPYREMHQEGEFPEAVLALVEAHGF